MAEEKVSDNRTNRDLMMVCAHHVQNAIATFNLVRATDGPGDVNLGARRVDGALLIECILYGLVRGEDDHNIWSQHK